jgi:RNA polymerase-binding transcription factor DksA
MLNINHFKEKLQKERAKLEEELKTVGHINPSNPNDWEANSTDTENSNADRNEVADQIENYEGNTAILKQLEIQLGDVKSALAKIEEGTYGICEVCKKEIPEARLEANPSARTCIEHSTS